MKKGIIMFCAGAALVFAIPAFAAIGGNAYETYTGMSGGSHMQKTSSADPPGGAMANYTGMKESINPDTGAQNSANDPGVAGKPAIGRSNGTFHNMTGY